MKKLTWTWKKIILLIATALGIGTLVSCYGMVSPEDYFDDIDYSKYENPDSENAEEITQADSETQVK